MQFAVNRETDEIVVIEMNPRVSRSSALASKATGFPIAKIAARLAVGYTLQEIPNDITKATPASFEPAIDYCVVKWPRFAFEKFPGAEADLTTHMKSVGEAMALGRTFKQAFAKALRSRELDERPSPPEDDAALALVQVAGAQSGSTTCSRRWDAARAWMSCTAGRVSTRGSSTSSRSSWPIHKRRSPACGRSRRSTPVRASSRLRRPTSTPVGSVRAPTGQRMRRGRGNGRRS